MLASRAYLLAAFTASLNCFPGVNPGTVIAAMLSSSPVLGLRPFRAARSLQQATNE